MDQQLIAACQSEFGWTFEFANQITKDLSRLSDHSRPGDVHVETEWTSNAHVNMAWRLGTELKLMNLPEYCSFQAASIAGHQDLPKFHHYSISTQNGQSMEIWKEGSLDCEEAKSMASRYFEGICRHADLIVLSKQGTSMVNPVPAGAEVLVISNTDPSLAYWIEDLKINVFQELELLHQESIHSVFSDIPAGIILQSVIGDMFPIARREGCLQNLSLDQNLRKNNILSGSTLLVQLPQGTRVVFVLKIETLERMLVPLHPEMTIKGLRDAVKERMSFKKKNQLLLWSSVNLDSLSPAPASATFPNKSVISFLEWN